MNRLLEIYEEIWDDVRGWPYFEDSVSLAAHIALCFSVAALVIFLGKIWMDTPVVVFSYPGNECVEVRYADAEFTCWNLPKRYERMEIVK